DAGVGVARAAWIGGAAGTATVVAGRAPGGPPTGTMAPPHGPPFGRGGAQAALQQFLPVYPPAAPVLADTHPSVRGARSAIAPPRATGVELAGVRLDSGDLGALARAVRRLLDAAGLNRAQIVASDDLDEWRVDELVRGGAPIDVFGVGTALGTSSDAPAP